MHSLAPIVLFVYNRPWHTQQTLEALSKNELANQSTLYIFCDGPKKNESPLGLENIQKTREIVRKQQWASKILIRENEENTGLGPSIMKGVTDVIEQHGKVIVLEDDLVTSTGFLKYMNDALNVYALEEAVMHVSGYWFPVEHSKELLPETFFYRSTSCWGWGTWKSAWQKLQTDAYHLKKEIGRAPNGISRFNIDDGYNHLIQLENNIVGKANTWAVKWYASVFLNNGLCLHPNVSLVNNIGMDNSGTNCNSTSAYDWPALAENIQVLPVELKENQLAVRLVRQYYRNAGGTMIEKLKRKVRALLN